MKKLCGSVVVLTCVPLAVACTGTTPHQPPAMASPSKASSHVVRSTRVCVDSVERSSTELKVVDLASREPEKPYIPGTQVEDTPRNREIIAFCERYRLALETVDIDVLVSMASPLYYDNAGTPDCADDMDRSALAETLETRFEALEAVVLEIHYDGIVEQDGILIVDCRYDLSFQYVIGDETKHSRAVQENRLEIEATADGYLFLAGM
jgi:hypothetical protein